MPEDASAVFNQTRKAISEEHMSSSFNMKGSHSSAANLMLPGRSQSFESVYRTTERDSGRSRNDFRIVLLVPRWKEIRMPGPFVKRASIADLPTA
jgi:hypothetical protein